VTQQLKVAANAEFANSGPNVQESALLITAVEGVAHDGDGVVDKAVDLQPNGEFYGLFYAPVADVLLPASLRFMGSITAQTLLIEEGSWVTFDQSLAYEGTGIDTIPRLISWHVIGLPDVPYIDVRTDPKMLLDEFNIASPPSKDAHFERLMELDYVDSSGSLQTYNGVPENLDWSQVSQVLSVEWFDAAGTAVNPFTWFRDTLDRPVNSTYDIEVVERRSEDQIWTRNGSARSGGQMQTL
jgi:hypothetical protein